MPNSNEENTQRPENLTTQEPATPSTVKPYKPLTLEQQAIAKKSLDGLMPKLIEGIDEENKDLGFHD